MATLREIIDYSKANPKSDYAQKAYTLIKRGDFDVQAQKEGIDLSWAGRPAYIPPTPQRVATLEQRKQEAVQAEIQAQKIASPWGQTKEFFKSVGEITGITPTAKRIAAGVAPYVVPKEELPVVVEELVGGVTGPRKMGETGKTLKEWGLPENLAEGVDIAVDLPLISLGLGKTIATTLEKQAIKNVPDLAKFLTKPLSEFAPDTLKKFLKIDITGPVQKKIGEISDTIYDVAGKPAGYLKERFPKLLGIFTGEDTDIIKQALDNPFAADKGIQGGDEALRKIVNIGSEKSVKLKNSFIGGYKESKNQLLGSYNQKILLPKNDLLGEFNKLLKENKVIIKNGMPDFSISPINANPGEVSKINAVYEALRKYPKFTLDELDDFKILVGKLTKFATEAGGSSKSPILGRFYHIIDIIIKEKLPKDLADKYTILNKTFSENIELFDDMVDAFNSGDPFTKLSNVFGKNKDTLRQVIDFYEKQSGEEILPVVAGRELAMERKAAFGFLNPRSWIDLFISPKLQAKIITRIGKLKK